MLQQAEVIGFGAEIADMAAEIARFADRRVHFRPGVAVETVAFQLGGADVQLLKDFTERHAGGGGAGPAGAGHCDNGMFGGHGGRSLRVKCAGVRYDYWSV
ncbi:hypothetical protein D3C71_1743720 [compost metagenome]